MYDVHYRELAEHLATVDKLLRAFPGQPVMTDTLVSVCGVLREVLVGLDNHAVETGVELEPRLGADLAMLTCCKAGHDFQVHGNRLLCPRCGEVR